MGISRRLDIMKWQAAFDKYMLAAAITEQMSLSAAMAHKDICVQVGMRAQFGAVTRRAALGVIYDEVARRSWAQRAAAGDFQSFHDISIAANKWLYYCATPQVIYRRVYPS